MIRMAARPAACCAALRGTAGACGVTAVPEGVRRAFDRHAPGGSARVFVSYGMMLDKIVQALRRG